MENKNFFRFTDNSESTRGFTWAYSIIPRSELFILKCGACGGSGKYPLGEFDVIVERGTKYPDLLGCGAWPFLIVSKAVVNDWVNAGITSFKKYRVGIAEVKSKRLLEVPKPEYYRIEIEGRCNINLKTSGLKIKYKCMDCGRQITEPSTSNGLKMADNSWDGSDLFRDAELYPFVNFCTEKVMRLAGENKRTNFRFERMEGPYDTSSKGIDYLKLFPGKSQIEINKG